MADLGGRGGVGGEQDVEYEVEWGSSHYYHARGIRVGGEVIVGLVGVTKGATTRMTAGVGRVKTLD